MLLLNICVFVHIYLAPRLLDVRCGYFGDPSGPLLDRIDIHIEVPAVKYKELRAQALAEGSEAVRSRVVAARNRQLERHRGEKKTY